MGPRLTSLLVPLLFFLGGGVITSCAGDEARSHVSRLSAGDQGAAPDQGGSCPGVGKAGCCAGKGLLRYCAGGKVVNQPCQGGQLCGWSLVYGLYGCGKVGGADPAGLHAWACPVPDAGVDGASPDAASMADMGSCAGLVYAGCCQGQMLRFCAGGKALSLDCASTPKCGWNVSAGYYSCGTAGKADPKGQYPLACELTADAGGADVGAGVDGPAPDLGSHPADLASPVQDGPRVDTGWTTEGFSILPDTVPAGETMPGPDLSAADQGTGLDFTGFEGGAGDLGADPPVDEAEGCSCATSSARDEGGFPPALLLALLLLFKPRRGNASLALLLLLALNACSAEEPPGRSSRPLSGGDLASLDGPADSSSGLGCGSITSTGCCDGETLWWCQEGRRLSMSCRARPRCGWSGAGKYDCDTSGAADPSGKQPQQCRSLVGDAGLPASDGAGADGGPGCGTVTTEGCCVGQTLVYCQKQSGRLKTISCALNPSCGWHPGGQLYDCGTQGKADPAGKYPRACPSTLPGDLSLDGPAVPDRALVDHSIVELGGDAKASAPGGCSVGGGQEGGALLLLLLLAILSYPAASMRRLM